MLSDDHAYQAVSAYGHGLNNTPHIDRIASEGALFNRAFVTNSICAPSRAVVLTGLHSHLNGKTDNFHEFDWQQSNVAKLLQQAGYQTALVGKIHLDGSPQGFDYSMVLPGQGHYYNPDFIENIPAKNVVNRDTQIHGYVTTITTDLALDWLKNKRRSDQPFFLMYNQKAPHRNWMPEEKYFNLFDDQDFPLPETFFDNYKNRPAAAAHKMGVVDDLDVVYDLKMYGENMNTRYRELYERMYLRMDSLQKNKWDAYYDPIIEQYRSTAFSDTSLAQWKFKRYLKDYLRTIQSVDDGVGEILHYLDENNLSENTILIYTSDQGFYLGEHGWFDKRYMYEESLRTPLLIKYPREIKSGQIIHQLVQNLDFAPTLLDLCGLEIPAPMQGRSFRPLFSEKDPDWRTAIYYHYYEFPNEHGVKRHYGIRTDRYKLIHFYHDIDHWELYDLETDPGEINNRYDEPEFAELQHRLHRELTELRETYRDTTGSAFIYSKN